MTSSRAIDIAALIEGRKLSSFNYLIICVSVLITFLDGFDLLMLSHTAAYMADEIGLDKLQLGNIFSIGLFGMMLGDSFSVISATGSAAAQPSFCPPVPLVS